MPYLPHFLAFAFFCTVLPSAYARQTGAARAHFDATFYHLTLDLRFDPNYLYGRTRVEGRAAGQPLETLVLDFSSTMQVDSVRTADGVRLAFTHRADTLAIPLPAPVAAGQPVAVDVFYQGLPQEDGFGTFRFDRDPYQGNLTAWTLSEPYGARAWWPSNDHPSDKADSVRVTVTVPASMRVGSNGLLRQEIDHGDGTKTYDWFSRYPVAPYLVAFAAGVYDVYVQTYTRPDSLAATMGPLAMPVLHYAYRGTNAFQGDSLTAGWHLVTDVLPVFEWWFGPYPFAEEKYGHVHFTWSGGMEHQTMSSMGGSGIGLVAHELAHQWYGDLVTMRYWPHLWLNEGFATYGELLYYEARPERYALTHRVVFDLYYERALRAQGTLVVGDTMSVDVLFNGNLVYAKGGMVLHMLRGVVGDEAFRRILRAYAEAYAYGTATTDDLHRIAEAESGMDLDAFFRQWVTEGTGHPVYEVAWGYAPGEGGYEVTVTLEQTQTAPASNVEVFEMPVTFAIETTAGEERFTVWNDARVETYTFEVEAQPLTVVFDSDRRLLRNRSVVTTEVAGAPVRPQAPSITAVYPNPVGDVLRVAVAQPEPGTLQLALYDVLGRRVQVHRSAPSAGGFHTLTIDLGGLPAGTYFLRLEGTSSVVAVTRVDR